MKLFQPMQASSGSRSGGALIVALVTISVVASLGGAYLQVVTSATQRQSAEVGTLKAFYLAEAGLAEAFQAVRMGRSGQIGSIQNPAQYAKGLVWVDASQTEDDQIRLVATGMWGGGRASIAYVLEPKELTLGIFSEEDLDIDQVLMIDGYDSGQGSYTQQIQEEQVQPAGMPLEVESFLSAACFVGDGTHGCHLGYHQWCVDTWSHASVFGGVEGPDSGAYDSYIAERDIGLEAYQESLQQEVDRRYESYITKAMRTKRRSTESLYPRPGMGLHMADGGMLGSNGSISFDENNSELQEIYGEVVTGPGAVLAGETGIVLTGNHSPRGMTIDLPEVKVPAVDLQAPVRHASVLPMLIPSGLSGLERVEVAMDSELIIQGPATVVLGDLILEPGALLTLDTRAGDVALYVTGSMNLQPGSVTVTTGENPGELSVQVAPIASLAGQPPIRLDSFSQFRGTVYAPQTEVYVGSDFEVFGGVVAKKLTFGAGARLHVDMATYGGSPVPTIISWRILELPQEVQTRRANPYRILGVEPGQVADLSEANDLDWVVLELEYVDKTDTLRTFSGVESDFDWSSVKTVTRVAREAYRELEQGATRKNKDGAPVEELALPDGVRRSVMDIASWSEASGDGNLSKVILGFLKFKAPFSAEEWVLLKGITQLEASDQAKLSAIDIASGGPGL